MVVSDPTSSFLDAADRRTLLPGKQSKQLHRAHSTGRADRKNVFDVGEYFLFLSFFFAGADRT